MSVENPFLERIWNEPHLCKNGNLRVVEDADPIAEGHYLIYASREVPSLASLKGDEVEQFLTSVFMETVGEREYCLFERGCARFCSSFQGVVHGHGHLVPMSSCPDVVPWEDYSQYNSLNTALEHVEPEAEYLLWGRVTGTFRGIQPVEIERKRLIRKVIAGREEFGELGSGGQSGG